MNNIFQNIAVQIQDVNEAFAYITHWISYLNRGTCQKLFLCIKSRRCVAECRDPGIIPTYRIRGLDIRIFYRLVHSHKIPTC